MNYSKDNLKKDVSVCCQKTSDFLTKCAKWVGAVSTTSWDLTNEYCKLKHRQYKIREECLKLGKAAYTQWQQEKDISLIDKLQRIRNMESQAKSSENKVKRSTAKMSTLFGMRRRSSASIVVQKKGTAPAKSDTIKDDTAKMTSKSQEKTASSSTVVTEKKTDKKTTTRKRPVKPKTASSGSTTTRKPRTSTTGSKKTPAKKKSTKKTEE